MKEMGIFHFKKGNEYKEVVDNGSFFFFRLLHT